MVEFASVATQFGVLHEALVRNIIGKELVACLDEGRDERLGDFDVSLRAGEGIVVLDRFGEVVGIIGKVVGVLGQKCGSAVINGIYGVRVASRRRGTLLGRGQRQNAA